MRPTTRLLTGLILGAVVGLVYGWILRPIEYFDTAPDSLREDYRADYVLMVAEAYAGEEDLELARIRLAALGPKPPANLVIEAINFGVDHGFRQFDLETLNRLAVDLRSIPPSPEIGGP